MERTLVSDPEPGSGLGTQTRVVNAGAATVVDAFAPYEPTVQWPIGGEPTAAWTISEPRLAPNPWLVGLGSAGLAVAVVVGFCLGRTVPVSAASRPSTAVPTQIAGPAPSVPVVLPAAPDLSQVYPVAPATLPRTTAWSTPAWGVPRAPVPPVTIRPIRRGELPTKASTRVAPVKPADPLPPPVQLYGSRRPVDARVVASWWVPQG